MSMLLVEQPFPCPTEEFFEMIAKEAVPKPASQSSAAPVVAKKEKPPAPAPAKPAAKVAEVVEKLQAALSEIMQIQEPIDRVIAMFGYFDKEHPLPAETTTDPEVVSACSNVITPEPARWGKGIGFGNLVGETEAQKVKKQQVERQDANMKALFILFTKLVSERTLKDEDIPRICEEAQKSSFVYNLAFLCYNDSILDIAQRAELFEALFTLLQSMAAQKDFANEILLKNVPRRKVTFVELTARVAKAAKDFIALAEQAKGVEADPVPLRLSKAAVQMHSALVELKKSKEPQQTVTVTPKNRRAAPTPCWVPPYDEVMRSQLFESAPGIDLAKHFWHSTFKADTTMLKPKMNRILSEFGSLSTSLPLTPQSSIFVRCHAERMDVLKVLIIGPEGTPYENGCFVFDAYLPAQYPNCPPKCQLRTTGGGTVRFNPNLYDCGKVCLSLLGTWQGEPWGPKSTLLQLFVSIQSLIMVPHPYFNEPGWEPLQGTPKGEEESKKYNDERLRHTLNHAMSDHLEHPDDAFADVITAQLYLRRQAILAQTQRWLKSVADKERAALQTAVDRIVGKLSALETNPPKLIQEWIKRQQNNAKVEFGPSKLLLTMHCPTQFGQNLFVTGPQITFGAWDVNKAVPLRWTDGHFWVTSIAVPAGELELKFFIRNADGTIRYEDCANRKIVAKARKEAVVCESWTRVVANSA